MSNYSKLTKSLCSRLYTYLVCRTATTYGHGSPVRTAGSYPPVPRETTPPTATSTRRRCRAQYKLQLASSKEIQSTLLKENPTGRSGYDLVTRTLVSSNSVPNMAVNIVINDFMEFRERPRLQTSTTKSINLSGFYSNPHTLITLLVQCYYRVVPLHDR